MTDLHHKLRFAPFREVFSRSNEGSTWANFASWHRKRQEQKKLRPQVAFLLESCLKSGFAYTAPGFSKIETLLAYFQNCASARSVLESHLTVHANTKNAGCEWTDDSQIKIPVFKSIRILVDGSSIDSKLAWRIQRWRGSILWGARREGGRGMGGVGDPFRLAIWGGPGKLVLVMKVWRSEFFTKKIVRTFGTNFNSNSKRVSKQLRWTEVT